MLQGGVLYRSRVGLVSATGPEDLLFAGFKQGAFSLYFGDAPIFHFDLEGRWQRAYIDVTHYLKSLDTNVHAIDRVREGANLVLRRRVLGADEIRDLDGQIRGIALGLIAELDAGRLLRKEPPNGKAQPLASASLREFLDRIARWDAAAWDVHRRQYQATYGPLSLLPPDCHNAVVFQATQGGNRSLSFGSGSGGVHVIRTSGEFQQHVLDVTNLLGRRLLQARIAFLASGDVLRSPVNDVVAYLDILDGTFAIADAKIQDEPANEDLPRIEGIYAFLDDFSSPCPDRSAFQAFRKRHLKHISLGIESGAAHVRDLYHKTWRDVDLRGCCRRQGREHPVERADFGRRGGKEHADSHVQQTSHLFSTLDLSRGDTVFLIDERELVDPSLEADDRNLLTGAAWAEQQAHFKQALAPLRERGVKVLPYSLEKQWA